MVLGEEVDETPNLWSCLVFVRFSSRLKFLYLS